MKDAADIPQQPPGTRKRDEDECQRHQHTGNTTAPTPPAALGRGRMRRLEEWPSCAGWGVCWCRVACVEEWPSFGGWRGVCWCRGVAGRIGWPVRRSVGSHGTPQGRPAVMRRGRSSWMHMYRTVGSPSRVAAAVDHELARRAPATGLTVGDATGSDLRLEPHTRGTRTIRCRATRPTPCRAPKRALSCGHSGGPIRSHPSQGFRARTYPRFALPPHAPG
jgi:hypothetical protein